MSSIRRVIVAVALCGVLAGCSGKIAPSALTQSICKAAHGLPISTPSKRFDVSKFYVGMGIELGRSNDPVFRQILREMTGPLPSEFHFDNDYAKLSRQLDVRCKALGL